MKLAGGGGVGLFCFRLFCLRVIIPTVVREEIK